MRFILSYIYIEEKYRLIIIVQLIMQILITGCCGFIGFSYTKFLLNKYKNIQVLGIDSLDNYYSISLKKKRLDILKSYNKKFVFYKQNLKNLNKLENIFKNKRINKLFHFAAQAGVRYSFIKPKKYIDSNIISFFNILELSRKYNVKKFFFASSSSIYGDTKKLPSTENDISQEKNLYAISKKFNEKFAKIYSDKYNMKIIGLRFFTVYGEWGRPDMFMIKYMLSSKFKKNFTLYNFGNHKRDFTYIKDVVNLIYKVSNLKINKNYDIFNICSSKPLHLNKIMNLLNKNLGNVRVFKKKRDFADVLNTHGSNKKIQKLVGKYKFTKIEDGIKKLVIWFNNYYKK